MLNRKFDPAGANTLLICIALFKLLLYLIFAGNYGLFRDEFYYLECSKHLAWGYVDQPPLSIFILYLSRSLFGDSILGIRIFAYLAGSATVFVCGLIARELGGAKFAQALAAVCAVFSGVILGGSSYFSMNAFDVCLSAITFLVLIKMIKTDNPKYWIWLGVLFGIGLENKLTFLFLASGLTVALLLTKQRKYFLRKEMYIGAAIAFALFLPHIIWQIVNHFPTLEFMRNASSMKNVRLGFAGFFVGSMMELNPGYIIFVVTALYFLFFNKDGKTFSVIGWIYIVVLVVFVLNGGKPYYMGVLYPVLIAAGVVGADSLIQRYLPRIGRTLLVVLLIPVFVIPTPFAVPILSVESFVAYSQALGIKPASGERSALGVLPQFFADRFGWKDMVEKVADAYGRLSEEEKKKALIFGQNYGEAGAVNFYRKQYGLPPAISHHNSFWMWGYPADYTGEVMIVIGSNLEDNSEFFEQVDLAASHTSQYGMPYENVDIFICRKPKMPMSEIWKRIKMFI